MYPNVKSEQETLELIKSGMSIARYGDGEIKLCGYRDCISQVKDAKLKEELNEILQTGSNGHCLVGVPPLDCLERIPAGKKREFWTKQQPIINKFLNPNATYHSSFITRPDNAPWIANMYYWKQCENIWRDKDVTLVLGSERSLCTSKMTAARSIKEVWGPRRDAYADIDGIQKMAEDAGNELVIICLGAAGTALAWRMAKKFHALDLGHIGMMNKWFSGAKTHDQLK